MQSFIEVGLPLFGIVLLGYVAARVGWLAEATVDGLSRYVFDFAIPLLLFRSMATLEAIEVAPWRLLASYYGAAFAVFALGAAGARFVGADAPGEAATMGFGASFSNTVLLGIPLVLTLYGEQGALPLFMLVALHSLLLLTTAIVTLELARGRRDRLAGDVGRSLRNLATNPILLGLAAGLLWRATGWSLATPLDRIVDALGGTASPCALFAMGGSLSRYRVRGHVREAVLVTALKNFVMPALVWLLATRAFDIDPVWAKVAVVVAAMPTGVNVYLFAHRYDAGTGIASSAVVISTTVSLVTVSVLLALLA